MKDDEEIKYKCGHVSNGVIILDNNLLSLIAYQEWAESVGVFGTKEMCWDCYCKKEENEK